MIVMKFGGTSTQDAAAISNVVRIIGARLAQKPVIVISAIAQATNMLEKAGKLAAEGRSGESRDVLLQLFDRHYTIVDQIISDRKRHQDLRKILASSLGELEELVKGVTILHELTSRTLDAFYCYGELLSSRIVAAALQERGIMAEWIDTKEFLLTDDNFSQAAPMMDVVEERLTMLVKPLLSEGKVPVTQGFIGVTTSGRRSTMGRESSDYSASIIGSALHVDEIQIWTDVDGVLTADPRIVSSPKKIKVLSFEEAYELSYFGAKVLHPKTMLPAMEKNIPISIFNSLKPDNSGTCVSARTSSSQPLLKSVAYKRNVSVLNVIPKKHYSQYIFWEHIFNVLTKYDAAATMSATSELSAALVLDAKTNISGIVHELREIGIVEGLDSKGIVCAVGTNVRNTPHLVDRIFHSIADYGITLISFGASKSNISFIVDDDVVPDVIRKIHAEFFEALGDQATFEELEQRMPLIQA